MKPVRVTLFAAGTSRQLQAAAERGGPWRMIEFPATWALIEHAAGRLLFDTGYAPRYFRATRPLPQRLYRWAVPVTLPAEQTALAELGRLGIQPAGIDQVLISHLHADHIGGLRDFPDAEVLLSGSVDLAGATPGRRSRGRAAVAHTRHGFLPELLPPDLAARRRQIEHFPVVATGLPGFPTGFDLLGDGSAIMVALPGHTGGHVGLWLPQTQAVPLFLVGDAVWLGSAITGARLPPPAVLGFAAHRREDYLATAAALAALARELPQVQLLPSHCAESLAKARMVFGGGQ